MRRSSIFLVVILAITACQKSEVAPPENEDTGMHRIDFSASFGESRTTIVADGQGGYSFNWNEGDQVRVWESVEGGEMASSTASVSASGSTAEFSCSFPSRAADAFSYLAVYPYQYDVSQTFKDYAGKDRFRIKMPEQQTMLDGTFDPSSDLLVSEIKETESQPSKIDLRFGRIGSILQLCVKGLDDKNGAVSSIKFTSDCLLAGYVEFDPQTGAYSLDKFSLATRDRYDNPVSFPYVWLNAPSDPSLTAPSITDGSITFWARTFPAQINEFSIEVVQRAGPRSAAVTTFRRYNVNARSVAKVSPVSLEDGKMTKLTLNIGDEIPVSSVAIAGKPANAVTGNTYQLGYTLAPLNASVEVSWTSSDQTKARIDNYGLLTAYSAGDVTITCTAGSVSDNFVLSISESIPETVDLGLPSGTLWSSCNLGANTPSGYGLYYSWGDPINTKKKSGKSNYKFWKYNDYHDNYLAALMGKYCLDGAYSTTGQPDSKRFLDPEDDPATSHLGDGWRSPTNAEFEELKANCDLSRESIDGVNCIRFTSKINGNSIVFPLAGWDTDSRRGEMSRLWTCEQPPYWYELSSNLVEYAGVTTDITQTNKKTWAKLNYSNPSTGNIWASAYVLDPATTNDISFSQKYFERYMYAYSIRPVKAGRPSVDVPVHITSVENLSATSARVNVEFSSDEYNAPGVNTTHNYKFGWTKEGVTSYPSEQGTTTRTTARTVSYTISGLTAGKEYVVYAHYQRKAGSASTEDFYSDNRVRFKAQADPAMVLTAFSTSPASLILDLGTSKQLTPVPVPSTAPVTVTYQSTNPSVATVDYNTALVTAVGKGKAQIYCIAQGTNTVIPYYCPVTVPDHLDYGNQGGAGNDINDSDIIDGGTW